MHACVHIDVYVCARMCIHANVKGGSGPTMHALGPPNLTVLNEMFIFPYIRLSCSISSTQRAEIPDQAGAKAFRRADPVNRIEVPFDYYTFMGRS